MKIPFSMAIFQEKTVQFLAEMKWNFSRKTLITYFTKK